MVYEDLKVCCDELGITLSDLCRETKVDRNLVQRWSKKNPKSIEIYFKLQEGLKEISKQKNLENVKN
jgi:hypothetical protein